MFNKKVVKQQTRKRTERIAPCGKGFKFCFSQVQFELNAESALRAALKIRCAFGVLNTFVHKKITHILKSYHFSGRFATVFLYNSKNEKIFRFPLAKPTGMLYN